MRFASVVTAAMLVLSACTSPSDEQQLSRGPEITENNAIASAESQTIRVDETHTSARASKVARFADLNHGVTTRSSKLKVGKRPTPSSAWRNIATTNPIDQRLVLLIRSARSKRSGDWFEVFLPERPNRSTAWVKRKHVRVVKLSHRIEVDLSRYTLKHFRNDELVRRFKVGVGQDRYPTPKGVYYVWAKVPQPNPSGPYGNYALGLSGFSVLSDWPGGGRAAVHGTVVPGDRGRMVSHGCVRLFYDDMKKLTGVPMGTPVVIRR